MKLNFFRKKSRVPELSGEDAMAHFALCAARDAAILLFEVKSKALLAKVHVDAVKQCLDKLPDTSRNLLLKEYPVLFEPCIEILNGIQEDYEREFKELSDKCLDINRRLINQKMEVEALRPKK